MRVFPYILEMESSSTDNLNLMDHPTQVKSFCGKNAYHISDPRRSPVWILLVLIVDTNQALSIPPSRRCCPNSRSIVVASSSSSTGYSVYGYHISSSGLRIPGNIPWRRLVEPILCQVIHRWQNEGTTRSAARALPGRIEKTLIQERSRGSGAGAR